MQNQPSLTDEFFRIAIDNVAIAGFDGYFKVVSESWCETLGWPMNALKARPVVEFVHPDDRSVVLESRARLRTGEVVSGLQNRYRCRDGSFKWFEWRARADLERELVFAVARDITEQKENERLLAESRQREEELRHRLAISDRLTSIGTLAAGMAHEINNPLSLVRANLDLIREEVAQSSEPISGQLVAQIDEMVGDALIGVDRISSLIQTLTTFSAAPEHGRVEPIDLEAIVRNAVRLTGAEIRRRGKLLEDYGMAPLIEADASEVSQVVLNLLVNAVHALPQGDAENEYVRIDIATDTKGRAVLEIEDSGVGIPFNELERVFDPFFTRKPTGVGAGIGLSFCHAVVDRMGGEISVESEPGRGTTFRVAFPSVDDTEVTRD